MAAALDTTVVELLADIEPAKVIRANRAQRRLLELARGFAKLEAREQEAVLGLVCIMTRSEGAAP